MRIFNKNSSVVTFVVYFVMSLSTLNTAFAANPLPVDLLTAGNFVILAGTPDVTDTPTSAITGNVGLYPAAGSGIGLLCSQVTGTIYASDATGNVCFTNDGALLLIAKNDLVTAYNDVAGRAVDTTVATELGGTTLNSGVYDSVSTTFTITAGSGALVLDGQGNPDARFVFIIDLFQKSLSCYKLK